MPSMDEPRKDSRKAPPTSIAVGPAFNKEAYINATTAEVKLPGPKPKVISPIPLSDPIQIDEEIFKKALAYWVPYAAVLRDDISQKQKERLRMTENGLIALPTEESKRTVDLTKYVVERGRWPRIVSDDKKIGLGSVFADVTYTTLGFIGGSLLGMRVFDSMQATLSVALIGVLATCWVRFQGLIREKRYDLIDSLTNFTANVNNLVGGANTAIALTLKVASWLDTAAAGGGNGRPVSYATEKRLNWLRLGYGFEESLAGKPDERTRDLGGKIQGDFDKLVEIQTLRFDQKDYQAYLKREKEHMSSPKTMPLNYIDTFKGMPPLYPNYSGSLFAFVDQQPRNNMTTVALDPLLRTCGIIFEQAASARTLTQEQVSNIMKNAEDQLSNTMKNLEESNALNKLTWLDYPRLLTTIQVCATGLICSAGYSVYKYGGLLDWLYR